MLINLRNALMSGKRLPYDAEVEFLASTEGGGQYINTGVQPSFGLSMSATLCRTDTSAGFLLGARQANATNSFCLASFSSYARFDFGGTGGFTGQTQIAPICDGIMHTLAVSYPTITLDGTAATMASIESFSLNQNILLFANNTNGTIATYSGVRISALKFYVNGVLVRDYIPVRVGTTGELYDRVSGTFATRHGDFTFGGDVVPVEYIESYGTEYINAGFATTGKGLRVRLACEKTTSSTSEMAIAGRNGANGFELYFSGGQCGLWNSSGKYVLSDVSIVQGTKYSIDASIHSSGASLTVNGSERTSTFTPYEPSAADVLMLRHFSRYYFIGKMYPCEMWNNSVLTRSYYPVRVGTEGAMMDVLTRRIYRNAGTGAFTYGNDLKYPIPAE